MTVLEEILSTKRREVASREAAEPLDVLRQRSRVVEAPRGFRSALAGSGDSGDRLPRIVAEVKRASPSRGIIRADFDPLAIASGYERAGAAALSVLTDEPFFQGHLEHLRAVHDSVGVPVLRKDFILAPYQVWEARAAGADAILLIVAALADRDLERLHRLGTELGMDVLVEVHGRAEMERAGALGPDLIGINNRDLHTFEVTLETTRALLPLRPPGALIVSESGFSGREEVDRMRDWGVDAFLIGESFMRAPDPGAALAEMLAAGDGT